MARRKEGDAGVLELVVTGERKTEALGATLHPTLTDELPGRRVMRVDRGREVPDAAIHLSQQLVHDTLLKSRLP
jgi:hypothetical protein